MTQIVKRPGLSLLVACAATACAAPVSQDDATGASRVAAGKADGTREPEPTPSGAFVLTAAPGRHETFELPPRADALLLSAEASAGLRWRIESLVAPDGRNVVRDGLRAGFPWTPLGSGGSAAMVYPATTEELAMGRAAGRWTITVNATATAGSETPGTAPAVRLGMSWSARARQPALDLHLHVPSGLADGEANFERDLTRRVDAFFAALQRHFGIARGVLARHRAPAEAANVMSLTRLRELFGAELDARSRGLHVLLTRELRIGGTETWAAASGRPGPLGRSGLAIDIDYGFGPEADGLALAHELGHLAGLAHTTERGAFAADPLDDTPRCSGDALVWTDCPDATNLMFPDFYAAVQAGEELHVTREQRAIVRGAALLRR